MVEPRHQPITPLGRYSGVKEPPVRSWDRNKARIESIYQLPTRDFRQTAAQFGVPPSLADITVTEKGIPKMECTTTTKSDFCRPSLERYVTVPGVCPDKDYPSSSGLEYCPGRPQEEKPPQPVGSTPVMPKTRSTCPASMSSLLPNVSALPKLSYPPSIPQYPSCSEKNDDFVEPVKYSRNHSFIGSSDATKPPDYTPNVDYFSKQPDFKWPVPAERRSSYNSGPSKQEHDANFDLGRKSDMLPKPDFQGGGESLRNHLNYPVETEDHAEKKRVHDNNMERARLEYERMIGSPGSTVPLMKAGVDPPSAVAHYNVPDYTQGANAGGIVRPRFGAPNVEMKVPITDPSYPQPEHRIPPPEAGLTKMTYSRMDDGGGKPGVTYTPPVRYPDKIYNAAPDREQTGNAVARPPLTTSGAPPGRYVPSIIEAQEGEAKLASNNNPKISQSLPPNNEIPQPNVDTNVGKKELPSLKGIRRIQTTNQIYGSWIDDPYLKENDWWFKAKAKMPLQKTYLTKYVEENKWH